VVVRLVALRVGKRPWFSITLFFGDDLVIADGSIMDHYLFIARHFGVPINLHKYCVGEWVHQNLTSDGSAISGEVSALRP